MAKSPFLLGGLCALALLTRAASAAPALDPRFEIQTVRLWDGPPPGAKGNGDADIPTLTVFRPQPKRDNGTAVVIAPGGAYLGLAMNLEGRQAADWFTVRGVTAFVLRYRLGARYPYPVPLEDAERAVRWVRQHATDYRLDVHRIGVMGFSAGGHLAAMVGTAGGPGPADAPDPVDRLSSRPDFMVLGYPWLNAMQADPADPKFIRSYETLLKLPPAARRQLESKYTPALRVTANTPPTFIYSTTDDTVVPVGASVAFYQALVDHGVSAELHLFRHGGHGSGLGANDPDLDRWPGLLEGWLRALELLPGPTPSDRP